MHEGYTEPALEDDEDGPSNWVVLDPGDAETILAVLTDLAEAGADHGWLPRAVREMQRALGRERECPGCGERWHHDDALCWPDDPTPPGKFTLYRLLDANSRVIYVGVTRNYDARMRVHRRNWPGLFNEVLVEHYPSAAEMLEAEAQAIHDEQPPLNSAGVG